MFVTFPSTFEVIGCSLSTEAYYEINSAIYPTSTLHNCEYAVFIKSDRMIKTNCKVDFIPFTKPTAKSIDTFLEPVTLHVSCLKKIYYFKEISIGHNLLGGRL